MRDPARAPVESADLICFVGVAGSFQGLSNLHRSRKALVSVVFRTLRFYAEEPLGRQSLKGRPLADCRVSDVPRLSQQEPRVEVVEEAPAQYEAYISLK
jgi:hypothetical protein